MNSIVPIEIIATKIFVIRGKTVMVERDLAELYGVKTKRLNEQVRRNIKRFPNDFMFQLTKNEKEELVAICDRFNSLKHSTVLPHVFTQEGIAMLSSVLNSDRAIQVNIQIMRAFVQLRKIALTNRDLKRKVDEMERKYDKKFAIVFEAIKKLIEPPKQIEAIGFKATR
jgi:phage regulator Rha-like protein